MNKSYKLLNYTITIITAIFYAATLGWLFFHSDFRALIFSVTVPAVGVVLCSIARVIINAPRPYEVYDFENLLDKKTAGKSFPSRHVYCIFVIAMTVFASFRTPGAILFVLGFILMFLRVKTKVHFVRDVVAGAIFGIATGSILFFLI